MKGKLMLIFSCLVMWNNLNAQSPAFLFSLDYCTNTHIAGNVNNEIRQPSLSPSVAFLSKQGADLLVSGSFINNSDDSLSNFSSELDVMFGYAIKPFKNLAIYPSYTRFVYSRNSYFFNSTFTSDLRLDADYTYQVVSLGISSGYLMGKQHTFYSTLRNYYQFSFELFRHGSLLIQPGAEVNFGNYEYMNLLYLDQLRQDPLFYTYLLSNSAAVRRYVFTELIRHPDSTKEEIIDALLEKRAKDHFKLTSVNLNLPVVFMTGNISINLGLFVYIPFGQPDYLSDDAMFYFSAGVAYFLEGK